jgi:hypothetical protein
MVERITTAAAQVNWDTAEVVLQLFDNSGYLVGGPGGEKRLPCKDRHGTYQVDGNLTVAVKPVIKDLVSTLAPLLKVLGAAGNLS